MHICLISTNICNSVVQSKRGCFCGQTISLIFCDVFTFHLQASAVEDSMSEAYENFKIDLERVQVLYARRGKKVYFFLFMDTYI